MPAASEHAGHDRHAGHSVEMFRNRFWVCLVLTVPVLIYAEGLWELVGLDPPDLPGGRAVSFVLGTVIYLYGGVVFLRSAWGELRARTPGMMTLVALGITAAYAWSAATTFVVEGEGFYWELATLVDVMLLGHWIEMRSIGRAQGALSELAKLLPDTAERVTDGASEEVPVSELGEGDLVLVRPGGRVPTDGEVAEGSSDVNESMLTGESRPAAKGPGDEVIAGTVNGSGALRVRVVRTGEDTALAGIMRLVADAQASKSRAQAIADRAAMWLTYVAVGAGTVTAVAWGLLAADRGADFVVERAVTVVVIACPHALGLAVPLVVAISTSLSARNGLLVRNRLALERGRNMDVVVFDKTGTLTRGELGVVGIAVADGHSEQEALAVARGLEANSEHSLARAIVEEAERRGVESAHVGGFEALKGLGVRGSLDGRDVHLGGPRLLESLQARPPEALERQGRGWSEEGKTVVHLLEDGRVTAAFALADVIRDESREAVAQLKELGVRVAMITGDSEDVARWVAGELGLDEHFAQVLPQHKAERVKELQGQGRVVAMVGDGVNDAPALVQADVGIAIGAGTDVAIESADVILVRDDPRDVARVISLSRATYRKMLQNLAWATGYNAIALPVAAGVLAPLGVVLPPAIGALLMATSTVIVAINAQLLRRDRSVSAGAPA
ncbi:MAG TPA: heavy metal translocating P-type ATPase [Actinomycetota bacterium]|jgi:Cu2+-exporting ATPase|nr:heavy metal translocating P-type ATPase [Actinomycetota bacterium]